MKPAYLEIGALFEDRWTGIANVVAALATAALCDSTVQWSFCFDTLVVPHDYVRVLLANRSGAGGLRIVEDLAWEGRTIDPGAAKEAVGLYTNIKTMRRFFGVEAMMIYDLTPIITPEFHNQDSINHFANRIREDIASSDHLFCISKATMDDVSTYIGKAPSMMSVVRLGVDIDRADISAADLTLRRSRAEPYVVIVGTLEPRKNGRIMLDYLLRNPDFALRYKIVFIGREGWLDERDRLVALALEVGVPADRLLFSGYLSEPDKIALMLNASFCIYPSYFEGFGLPVLEAAVLGKTTICSDSSSLPEVAPESSIFFDASSVTDFGRALRLAEARTNLASHGNDPFDAIVKRLSMADWTECYKHITAWIKSQ